jgi:hypothetical protein
MPRLISPRPTMTMMTMTLTTVVTKATKGNVTVRQMKTVADHLPAYYRCILLHS